MSHQPSPVSLPKRKISVESRVRTGSDPTVYALKKSNLERAPSADHIVGQFCTNCTDKCHGYMPHVWRKMCITCGCARYHHSLDSDPRDTVVYLEGLNLQNGHSKFPSRERRLKEKYVWYPTGISPDRVEMYMQSLPKEVVPLRGSEGEKHRMEQYMQQLPAYDHSLVACHKMEDLDKKRMTKFIDRTKKRFFGVGAVGAMADDSQVACAVCAALITPGSLYVSAERAGEDSAWHPQCFRCDTCQELLVDLIYFHSPEKNVIYCGRHHGDSLVRRCTGCDELIFSSTLMESEGKTYHKKHFSCSECDTLLQGTTFKTVKDRLYCSHCYDKNIAAICEKCKEPIGIGAELNRVKEKAWHTECFVCKRCREDLTQNKFYLIKDDLLCGECVEPVAQCSCCKDAILPTASYVQDKPTSRAWHADCFKCVLCRAWLVDGAYNELDGNLMCKPCYAEKVGKKCTVCTKSIVGRGIKFSFNMYHPECFSCVECGQGLADGSVKAKEKEGKVLCQDCVLKTAKKCFRCCQPITSKHTIYKDKAFHMDCFTCTKCGSSAAISEFYETNLGEILCSRCGNN